MLPLPAPLGGFAGLSGDDLLDATERRVRPYYGEGLYGGEGSGHQCYRRGQVMGLAWAIARALAVQVNAYPDRALELLDEWEVDLGVPHSSRLTLEQRQARILARMREPRGADATNIEAALVAAAGGHYFVIENPYAGRTLAYLVRIYDPLRPGTALNVDAWNVLWRMTPAHVQCYVEYPDIPFGPFKLGGL